MGLTPFKLAYKPQGLVAAAGEGWRSRGRLSGSHQAGSCHDRVHRIAAVKRLELEALPADFAWPSSSSIEASSHAATRGICRASPRAGCRNQRGRRSCWPKSTMCSEPPGSSAASAADRSSLPVRDHRQRVGDEDAVEALSAEQSRARRNRWRRLAPASTRPASASRAEAGRGRLQHAGRDVEAEEARIRIARRGERRCCGRCRSRARARCRPAARPARRSAGRGRAGNICGSGRRHGVDGGRRRPSAPRGGSAGRPRSSRLSSHRDGSRHRSPSGRARSKSRDSLVARSAMVEQRFVDAGRAAALGSAAVRKMTRAPGAAVRVISVHSCVELRGRSSSPAHRAARSGRRTPAGFVRQKLGEIGVMDGDAADIGADRLVVGLFQIGGQGAFAGFGIAAGEGLPGEVVVLAAGNRRRAFPAAPSARSPSSRRPDVISESYCAGGMPSAEQRRLSRQWPADQAAVEQRRQLLLEEAALLARCLRPS